MRTKLALSLAVLAAVSILQSANAEEEHRELGAHEHGHGTLDIAIEGNKVAMELEAPGMDVVGFEHEAETDAQKAALAKSKSELTQPLALFKLPAAAGCRVQEARAELEAEHEHGDADDHAKAEAHDDEKHADADHEDHEGEGHTAFHVAYELECAKPADLTSITFDYFKTFGGAQSLTVNVVTEKGQSRYEVSRDKPQLDLTGMM